MKDYSGLRQVAGIVAAMHIIITVLLALFTWILAAYSPARSSLLIIIGFVCTILGCIGAYVKFVIIDALGVLVDNSQVIAQHVKQINKPENSKESMSAESNED